MSGRNYWGRRSHKTKENEFSVVTEASLAGGAASVEVGTSFTYVGSDATLSVLDNDKRMAGDAWRDERGTDRQAGTLTTNSGDTVDAGNIYAERYLILHASDGTCFILIEIEGTRLSNDPAQDDVFAFYGAVPAAGTELTVVGSGNIWFGVKYSALDGGPAAVDVEASDDMLNVAMDMVTTGNLLDNDTGDNAVVTSFGGSSVAATGGATLIDIDGIMFSVNPDGDISIDPQNSAAGIALAEGETLEIVLNYTIGNGANTSGATLTLTLEGVNETPEVTGLSPALDNFTLQEQQDGSGYSVDLAPYFSDPDGDALTLTSANLPTGFRIVDGVLEHDGTDIEHGDHTVTVTATDDKGASISTDLTFTAALNLSSPDRLRGQTVELEGTSIADSVEYTAYSAFIRGTLDLDLKGGDDIFRTTDSLAFRDGTATIDTGTGNDTVELASQTAYSGSMTVRTGSGDDVVKTQRSVALEQGSLVVETGSGRDILDFGIYTGGQGGLVRIDAGSDDDSITFDDRAASLGGTLEMDAGTGADTISFGDKAGESRGQIRVDLGSDSDTDRLSFGESVQNVTVVNWQAGTDAAIIVADPASFTGREENGNTVFEDRNGRSIVVEGVSGVPYGEIMEGYNYAPEVSGPVVIDGLVTEDDDPLTIDLLTGATDANGDQLAVTDVVGSYVDSNGTSGTIDLTVDTNGVATLDPSDFNTLGEGDSADITISFNIEDPAGRAVSNTATLTITGANDAPETEARTVQVAAGSSGTAGQLVATDVDTGDTTTWEEGVFTSDNGTLTVNPDGSFSYTPDADFAGVDTFTVGVTDTAGGTATQELRFEVATETITTPNGQDVTIGLNANAVDGAPYGNLSFELTSFSAPNINLAFALDGSGSIGLDAWETTIGAVSDALGALSDRLDGAPVQVDVHIYEFSTGLGGSGLGTGAGFWLTDPSLDPNLVTSYVSGDILVLGNSEVNDYTGVVEGSFFDIDTGPSFDLREDVAEVQDLLANLRYINGGTPWDFAFGHADTFFRSQPDDEQNILYFLTDGAPGTDPTVGSFDWEEKLAELTTNSDVEIQAFGIGDGYRPLLLEQVDSDGEPTEVTSFADLSNALNTSGLFPAELISFQLTLEADGVDQGVIADESSPALVADTEGFDLALADIAGLSGLLGDVNELALTAVIDLDGDETTTADQQVLTSFEQLAFGSDAVETQGTAGNDLILGSVAGDTLAGSEGNDLILGGDGEDTVIGGLGDDQLGGGADADTFVFASGDGADVLFDFDAGADAIAFAGGVTFADLSISTAGADVVIAYGSDQITVETANVALFTEDFFAFG